MTPAVKQLEKAGVAFELKSYLHDPRVTSYGLEAAEALGVAPEHVFKTLVAKIDGRDLVVAIVPTSGILNLKALARAAGGKRAEMADLREAERATGYVAGGISPFGQKRHLLTVLDESARALSLIHVSGGRRGLEIAIAPPTLIRVLDARAAPISTP